MLRVLLVVEGSYALGCVVGAYYIVRFRTGADVRTTGSGNAGARNVFRSGDRASAIATFAWDFAKGALAVSGARWLVPQEWAGGLALLFAVIGHIWPMQLGYRGGKGVATAIGGLLVIIPLFDGSWLNFAFVALAGIIVIAVHQPAFERHRQSCLTR